MGLKSIIEKMMPGARIALFNRAEELKQTGSDDFFHYFVSSRVLLGDAVYFLERRHKTIVLVHGDESGHLPQQLHTLNVCQPEGALIKSIYELAEQAHRIKRHTVNGVPKRTDEMHPLLTTRETEVLRLVVSGLINKEIANRLNVSLPTVISHRKNITEKLNIKNVSGLTIYAVTHGIVQAEEI